MLRIAICDEEIEFAEKVSNIIKCYLGERDVDCNIEIFGCSEEIIKKGIEVTKYNMFFLGIKMEYVDGIKIAEYIRTYTDEIFIIFITKYIEYSLEGYKLGIHRYILKDCNLEKSIDECLNSILKKINIKYEKRKFFFKEGEKEVSISKIVYIESNLHMIEFRVIRNGLEKYTLVGKLKDIECELGEEFCRIHQSFLVNLKYVKRIQLYRIILINGLELPIAKSRYRKVKMKFLEFNDKLLY